MAPLRYDPPAFMTDFDSIPGQLQAWSDAVSGWITEVVAIEQTKVGDGNEVQYYNLITSPQPGEKIIAEIVWNAFPKTLRMIYGDAAYEIAERLYPLSQSVIPGRAGFFEGPQWDHLFYRPLDEYCEFRVERGGDGKITRVTFTSEPPEYWQALHGDTLPDMGGRPKYKMPGDPKKLLALYRELVDPAVQLHELICAEDLVDESTTPPQVVYRKGDYNPYNKWNSTHGIAHLGQPNNTLGAEIRLGGDATILRKDRYGNPVTLPEPLCCASLYGGPNRTSDPTIGATVNDIARAGAYVTLRNPVGLYMDNINLAGFETPDGKPVTEDYFVIERGRPAMIERAVFAVPKGMKFTVGDLRIGGVPIRFGGQISEHINVKLVGEASSLGHFHNEPQPSVGRCCIDPQLPRYLAGVRLPRLCPNGASAAFENAGTPQAKIPQTQVELLAVVAAAAPALPEDDAATAAHAAAAAEHRRAWYRARY
jgi:hypothetical protein